MKGKSIWAVVAGVLVTIVVTTIVDVLLHVTGVFPGKDQPLDDALALAVLALPQCWLGGKMYQWQTRDNSANAA